LFALDIFDEILRLFQADAGRLAVTARVDPDKSIMSVSLHSRIQPFKTLR